MTGTPILISGGGIAGLTLAYWLEQFGFAPTIVEKGPDLRAEGYMIDFYGSGFVVAEKMGVLEQLEAKHYALVRAREPPRHLAAESLPARSLPARLSQSLLGQIGVKSII